MRRVGVVYELLQHANYYGCYVTTRREPDLTIRNDHITCGEARVEPEPGYGLARQLPLEVLRVLGSIQMHRCALFCSTNYLQMPDRGLSELPDRG